MQEASFAPALRAHTVSTNLASLAECETFLTLIAGSFSPPLQMENGSNLAGALNFPFKRVPNHLHFQLNLL